LKFTTAGHETTPMHWISSIPEEAFIDLGRLYISVGEANALLGASCRQDGKCCRFEESDLRLYVTDLEMAYFIHEEKKTRSIPQKGRCPFQLGNKCMARRSRPLGCRIFFCDAVLADRINDLYEKFHKRLIALHEKHGLNYSYQEFLSHPLLSYIVQ